MSHKDKTIRFNWIIFNSFKLKECAKSSATDSEKYFPTKTWNGKCNGELGDVDCVGCQEIDLPDVVGHRQSGASIQQDLEDLVIIAMGGQYQRSDIGREGRGGAIHFLPTLQKPIGRSVSQLFHKHLQPQRFTEKR